MAATGQNDVIEPAEVSSPGVLLRETPESHVQDAPSETSRPAPPMSHGSARRIPASPVGSKVLYLAATCAFSGLISGAVLVSVGVVVSGLVGFHAGKSIPPLWWCGIMPFLVSMAGIHMLVKRNRKKIYHWGLAMIVVAMIQTCIMGWLGNFSTSKYDAWPPAQIDSICRAFNEEVMCFCIDEYHGAYSHLQLPGVKYILLGEELDHNATKWRETMFSDCSVVKLISLLYFVCMGSWGVFLLAAVLACIVAHAGSVCASIGSRDFERLREDAESHYVLTTDELAPSSSSSLEPAPDTTTIPAVVHIEHVTVA